MTRFVPVFRGLSPPQTKLQIPQIATCNTINQWSFCQFLECPTPAETQSPLLKISGDGSGLFLQFWNVAATFRYWSSGKKNPYLKYVSLHLLTWRLNYIWPASD